MNKVNVLPNIFSEDTIVFEQNTQKKFHEYERHTTLDTFCLQT